MKQPKTIDTLLRTAVALALVLGFTGSAFAANVTVEIPKEGWSIAFDSPSLTGKQESKRVGEYAFKANSGRFNISLFVGKPNGAGSTHRDCYEFYWPQASRNPMIAKDTVLNSETPRYVRVQYDIITEFQGQPIRQRHVNYYFAFRGKWVDVHISVIVPTQADEEIFAAFDRSLLGPFLSGQCDAACPVPISSSPGVFDESGHSH